MVGELNEMERTAKAEQHMASEVVNEVENLHDTDKGCLRRRLEWKDSQQRHSLEARSLVCDESNLSNRIS